jgi:hypothetical protein
MKPSRLCFRHKRVKHDLTEKMYGVGNELRQRNLTLSYPRPSRHSPYQYWDPRSHIFNRAMFNLYKVTTNQGCWCLGPAINNWVIAVLVASNIIYISSFLESFANEITQPRNCVVTGAATFAPKLWFENSIFYKLIEWLWVERGFK